MMELEQFQQEVEDLLEKVKGVTGENTETISFYYKIGFSVAATAKAIVRQMKIIEHKNRKVLNKNPRPDWRES